MAQQIAKAAKVSKDTARQSVKMDKAGLSDDVIAGKIPWKEATKRADKVAPPKRRKPTKPEKPFKDHVWQKWSGFLQHWLPADRKLAKPILREFIAVMSKHWPQNEQELEFVRSFLAFMAKNWPDEQSKEALLLIHNWTEPTK